MVKRIFKTPGRVEIGGNHTDHQNGRVLTAAINLEMTAQVEALPSNIARIISDGFEPVDVDLTDLSIHENEKGTIASLVRGVAAWYKNMGFNTGGFNAEISSDIPVGMGLSSSAAFEVLIGNIFKGLYGSDVSAEQIAICGKFAENEYFGKPSGLMDQMASSVGGLLMIDFLDKNKPTITPVKNILSGYTMCVVETGDSHEDLTAEYASITTEMRKIAEHFGKELLRNVSPDDFYSSIKDLRRYGDRAVVRAIHFFEDNDRVLHQAAALEAADVDRFMQLVKQSGRSSVAYLQNIYSCQRPAEQGLSVALGLCEKILGNDGAYRVHGGGFGGTVLVFVPEDMAEFFKGQMEAAFGIGTCRFLEINDEGGREEKRKKL